MCFRGAWWPCARGGSLRAPRRRFGQWKPLGPRRAAPARARQSWRGAGIARSQTLYRRARSPYWTRVALFYRRRLETRVFTLAQKRIISQPSNKRGDHVARNGQILRKAPEGLRGLSPTANREEFGPIQP